MPVFNAFPTVLHAAEAYLALGYSVIPLWGDADPDRAKAPAVSWKGYQRRRAAPEEVSRWFAPDGYQALGIITGGLSQLAVLDFDSEAVFHAFRQACPQLALDNVIRTRRGCHVYFHLPPAVHLPSRHAPGLDVQAERRYVVAPPSVINGHPYTVVRAGPLHTLAEPEARAILAFVDGLHSQAPPAQTASGVRAGPPLLTASQATGLYLALVEALGRNEALFYTSRKTRDSGWSPVQTLAALVNLHAHQPPRGTHRRESTPQRRQEAVSTIRSAYARPPQTPAPTPTAASYVPNHLREKLLSLSRVQGTAFLRVYEALTLCGQQPGDQLTEAEITHRVRPLGVGRRAVLHALHWLGLFTPSTLAQADNDTPRHTPKPPCESVRPTKCDRSPNPAHRPPVRYALPDTDSLCRRLGVQAKGCDPIRPADLASPTTYRQALHREFIRRRPGIYATGLLGLRVGVCARTLQRYNAEIPIHSRPTYRFLPITPANVHRLPASRYWAQWSDVNMDACALVTEKGCCYAVHPDTAARLLQQGRAVWLRERRFNYYWYGDHPPDLPKPTVVHALSNPDLDQAVRDYWAALYRPPETSGVHPTRAAPPPAPEPPLPPVAESEPQRKPRRVSKRRFRKPLADPVLEHLAQRVHASTNPSQWGNAHGMSLYNARRLVDTYGSQAVDRTLRKLHWLMEQGRIHNPAGFMVTVSRVEWRVLNGATALGAPAPRFQGEPKRKGRSTYKPPEKDPLWKSVAWRRWRAAFEVEITGDPAAGDRWLQGLPTEQP